MVATDQEFNFVTSGDPHPPSVVFWVVFVCMLQIAMEEQLKVLTELVQQLQTDNQQLQQELVRRSVVVVVEA